MKALALFLSFTSAVVLYFTWQIAWSERGIVLATTVAGTVMGLVVCFLYIYYTEKRK